MIAKNRMPYIRSLTMAEGSAVDVLKESRWDWPR
jgi:hypothetical protein